MLADEGIVSANIVGYNTLDKGAVMYPSFSACFVPVSGATSFKLKELKPTGLLSQANDLIQTLNPTTTEQSGMYLYFSYEESREADPTGGYDEYIGWWKGNVGESDRADDVEIPVGTGFLGQVLSESSVSFQSAGEAPTYTTSFTTDGSMYPFFGNYLPKDLKLKDIVPAGLLSQANDLIQTLDPATTEQSGMYLYFSYEESREADPSGEYDEYIGWWTGNVGESDRADDVDVPAGTAFLGQVMSGSVVEFKFPSVLD